MLALVDGHVWIQPQGSDGRFSTLSKIGQLDEEVIRVVYTETVLLAAGTQVVSFMGRGYCRAKASALRRRRFVRIIPAESGVGTILVMRLGG